MRKVIMKASDIYDQIHSLKCEVHDLEVAIDELTHGGEAPSGRESVSILKKVLHDKKMELKATLNKEWVPDLVSGSKEGIF